MTVTVIAVDATGVEWRDPSTGRYRVPPEDPSLDDILEATGIDERGRRVRFRGDRRTMAVFELSLGLGLQTTADVAAWAVLSVQPVH